jgi:hypothetical protein
VAATEDYSVSRDGQSNIRYAPEGFRVLYGSNEVAVQRIHRRVAEYVEADARG